MTTKEFAKLCGVEKRTLFYYDQIGLLKLETVLENGYRDYSQEQVKRLEDIKFLQATGLSLSEIKALLMNEEEGGNVKIVEECVRRAEEQIIRMSNGRNYLLHRMELRNSYLNHIGEEYFIEHMESSKLSIIRPDYRPGMSVNYHSLGYYLGVAEDAETLKPKYFFKHALPGEDYIPFVEDDYMCLFIERTDRLYLPPCVEEFVANVRSMGYSIEDTVYVEDMPSWIIDKPKTVIVRLSVRILAVPDAAKNNE